MTARIRRTKASRSLVAGDNRDSRNPVAEDSPASRNLVAEGSPASRNLVAEDSLVNRSPVAATVDRLIRLMKWIGAGRKPGSFRSSPRETRAAPTAPRR